MKRQLTYDIADDGRSLLIDFDNNAAARYQVQMRPDEAESGDGIVLAVILTLALPSLDCSHSSRIAEVTSIWDTRKTSRSPDRGERIWTARTLTAKIRSKRWRRSRWFFHQTRCLSFH